MDGVRCWTQETPLSLDTKHPDDGWATSDNGGARVASSHFTSFNWDQVEQGMGRGWDGGLKVTLVGIMLDIVNIIEL